MNIYLKLLYFLNENQGYQNIEDFFGNNNIKDYNSKITILQELSTKNYIKYYGGKPQAPPIRISTIGSYSNTQSQTIRDFYAMITIEGIESLQPTKNKNHLPETKDSKNFTIMGDMVLHNGASANILSDNSKIETSKEVLVQLENMIELIRHNSNMDNILKAKLIDMNEELQVLISQSDKSKLPIFDNLVSLAANFASLYGLIK